MYIAKAILAQAAGCPIGGLVEFRRTGEPWAIDVGQVREMVHYLGAVVGFSFDTPYDTRVDFRLRPGGRQ